MIGVTELRKGVTFELDGALYRVLEYSHNKPGRGNATIRTKLRNCGLGRPSIAPSSRATACKTSAWTIASSSTCTTTASSITSWTWRHTSSRRCQRVPRRRRQLPDRGPDAGAVDLRG